jgi:NAD(P)-dependent dehydrogenase (short-subunit alcohol dehydrogenase family)
MRPLVEQVILVTGATGGLGKAVAMRLARSGATLLLHGRDETRGQQTLEEIRAQMGNTRLHWYRADFSSLAQVRAMAARLAREQEHLALLDSPVALAAWMLDHDTDSYYKISRAFLGGQPSGHLTRDRIVDNITLYWLTGTKAPAARSTGRADKPQLVRPARLLRRSRSRSASPRFPARSSRPRAAGSSRTTRTSSTSTRWSGRPLRRLGGARAVRDRDPGGVPLPALVGARERRARRVPAVPHHRRHRHHIVRRVCSTTRHTIHL